MEEKDQLEISRYLDKELPEENLMDFIHRCEGNPEMKAELQAQKNLRAYLAMIPIHGKPEEITNYKHFESLTQRKSLRRRILVIMGYAATALACIAIAWWGGAKHSLEQSIARVQKVEVPYGQRVNITLPDGSTAWLNSSSTLEYSASYGQKERKVRLVGEGYFVVEHDAKLPFLVSTSRVVVKDLGTAFSVKDYSDDDFSVSLFKGRVSLYPNGKENEAVELKPGQKASFQGYDLVVTRDDLGDTEWKEGIISFRDKTLSDIVKELRHYYPEEVIIENSALGATHFSATFRTTGSLMTQLRLLQMSCPFQIKSEGNKRIILY